MKMNKMNKVFITLIAVIIVVALFASFTACNGKKVNWSEAQANINNVKSMTCKIVMTDKGVNVLDYEKTVEFEGAIASVNVVETKLGDDFQYQTDETSRIVENADKSTLLPLNTASEILSTLNRSSSNGLTVYEGELEEVFVNQLINTRNEFEISGTARISIKCKGNNVNEITLDYVTNSGRVVSVVYSYAY